MTNPLKGETALEVAALHDGETVVEPARSLTLSFSVDALCHLEDRLDKTAIEIAGMIATAPRLKTVRTLLWAALQDHHGQEFPGQAGEKAAGELIPRSGGQMQVMRLIVEALKRSFPQPKPKDETEGAAGEADPPPPATDPSPAGTGNAS